MPVAFAKNKANGFYDPMCRLIPKPIQAELMIQKVKRSLVIQGTGRILDELLIFLTKQGAIRAWNILLPKLATVRFAVRIGAFLKPPGRGDGGF